MNQPNQKPEFAHIVGKRKIPTISQHASIDSLKATSELTQSLFELSKLNYQPKGLFRFSNHEESNKADLNNLAKAMADLNNKRFNK